MIPWKLCYVLHRSLRHLWALDQLIGAQEVGTAIGVAFEENKRKAERTMDELVSEAFPKAG